jgi:uncharacterized membrane protein
MLKLRKWSETKPQVNRPGPSEETVSYAEPAKKSPKKAVTQSSAPSVNQTPVDSHHHEEAAQIAAEDEGESVSPALKSSRTYLWVGIMLMVVGVILGILFGKTALLISVAGLIFVIIGYSVKFF